VVQPDQPDPTAEMEMLEIVDGDTLRTEEASGFSSPGETIRYLRRDGAVERVVFGGVSAVPIEEYVNVTRELDRINLGGPHAAG
jgi:hypothetical protein